MKKLLLLTLLLAATYSLKAQQLLKLKPADSLSHQLMDKYFKQQPNEGFNLLQPSPGLNEVVAVNKIGGVGINNQDRMPVAVLAGNSKMPVAKIGGYYTMPIKRIGTEDPTVTGLDIRPGLPTFANPVK